MVGEGGAEVLRGGQGYSVYTPQQGDIILKRINRGSGGGRVSEGVGGGGGSSGSSPVFKAPEVYIKGNTVFIDGLGYSVPAQNQAQFIFQKTGGVGVSSQNAIARANAFVEQQQRQVQAEKVKIENLKRELERRNFQETSQILKNKEGQRIKVNIIKNNNQDTRVIVRTNLDTGEKTYQSFESPRGGGYSRQTGGVSEFTTQNNNKNYFDVLQENGMSIKPKKGKWESIVDISNIGLISSEKTKKIGDSVINAGDKISNYANRLFSRNIGTKSIQFLLGAGAEVTRIAGGFLQLPALTTAILKNPTIIYSLPQGLLEGVKSDLIKIKSISSGNAVSRGSGAVIALTYILPAISGGKIIANKIKLRNMAKLTSKDINKIKYVLNKRLYTLEKTLKQKGAITKISGQGFSGTKTGSVTNTKYSGLMRLSKRDASVLQTSVTRLKNGVSYNSISLVNMKFGNKLVPYAQKIKNGFVFTKVNGKLVKIPFSKIKYSSRELISWVIDSRGKLTANIFGKTKYFKNIQKFKQYLQSRHGIKVIKGLYKNPKIKNIPKTKGTSFAFQKKVSEKMKNGLQLNLYQTMRGTVRKKIFRRKSRGLSLEVIKPIKVKKTKFGKKYNFPKEKRTSLSSSFGGQKTQQMTKSKLVPPTRFVPEVARRNFNKLVLRSKSAKAIQRSLIKGATLTVMGTSLVARTVTGQLANLSSISRLNTRQLNRQITNLRQDVRPMTKQITRQISRQSTRLLTRQLTRQISKPLSRPLAKPSLKFTRIKKEIIKTPIPLLFGKLKNKSLSSSVQTYYVKIKRRGKIINLTPRPLTLRDAKDFLAYSVDNGLERTAWFEPLGRAKKVVSLPKKIKGYFSRNSRKLRPFRIRRGNKKAIRMGYIEKRKFFSDTPREKAQLRGTRRKQKRQFLSRYKPKRKQYVPSNRLRRRANFVSRNIMLNNLRRARMIRMRNLRKLKRRINRKRRK
jgi:hypothetical protein